MLTHPSSRRRLLPSLLVQTGIRFSPTPAIERIEILAISNDSRKITPGTLFVAQAGVQQDGHQYIRAAINAGAVAIILSKPEAIDPRVPCILVSDTSEALAKLAAAHSGLQRIQQIGEMRVIGITGTNGKSTTAHLICNILRDSKKPAALLGTIQYDLAGRTLDAPLTTPGALELADYLMEAHDRGARHAVMEVSSHALSQKRTHGIHYSIAVFTNITGDHLDYHPDFESYLLAKKILLDRLDKNATAVINADDPCSDRIARDCQARIVRFGIQRPADVHAAHISCDIQQSRFTLVTPIGKAEVVLALVGRHNISNALAAVAAGIALNIPLDHICHSLHHSHTIAGRLQRAEPKGHPFSIFVDYAHSDDALANVLSTLRPLTPGRLWCIFGCGGDRDRTKRPRMAAVSTQYADRIVVTSDNPRTEDPQKIIQEILTGFPPDSTSKIAVQQDRREAIRSVLQQAQAHDVVLIAGKGHENYQIIGKEKFHFDDVEEVQAFFRSRKN